MPFVQVEACKHWSDCIDFHRLWSFLLFFSNYCLAPSGESLGVTKSTEIVFLWPYFDVPFVQLEGCKHWSDCIDFDPLWSFLLFFSVFVHLHQANCLEYLSQQKLFMWPYFGVPFVQLEGCKYFRNYIDFGWLQSFMFFFVIWFFFFPAPLSNGRCQLVSTISSCGFLLVVFLDSKQSIICIDSNRL